MKARKRMVSGGWRVLGRVPWGMRKRDSGRSIVSVEKKM